MDTEAVEILRELRELMRGSGGQTACRADSETVRKHSERLTALELEVKYTRQDTQEIKEMLKSAMTDSSSNKDRILVS